MDNQKNVWVVGCGRWGSFIAWYLDTLGHRVTLYGRPASERMQALLATRQNEYLTLPESVTLATDYAGIGQADIVAVSVGSQSLRTALKALADKGLENKTVVLCMKGLEISTGSRLSQVAAETLSPTNKVAVWLGPGHVEEFYRGVPNCMVIDSADEETKDALIRAFSGELIRFYYGTDLLGNEIGAAAKNVIGIAAGMLEGLHLSSLKGALMSRGPREIGRLIAAMGGEPETVYGLCHLGDYEATLFSSHSHNLAYGKSVVAGTEYARLAEGYYTVKALCALGKQYDVELPICEAVYGVLYEGKEALPSLSGLFNRSLVREFF